MAYVVNPITNEDLTTKVVNGTGIFDELMTTVNAHLSDQFEKNRITGNNYAEVYLGQLSVVLPQAVLFLTERDKAYLNNLLIQSQIKLSDAQVILAEKQAELADAQIALAGQELLNQQQDLLNKQQELLNAQKQNELMAQQVILAGKQVELAEKELLQKDKELEMLDKQIAVANAQVGLTEQKTKTELAQILDTVDGQPVAGVIGAQVALYKQQKDGFLRDAEQKALKILADTWITRKTVDDGTPLPVGLDTASLDAVITKVKTGINVT